MSQRLLPASHTLLHRLGQTRRRRAARAAQRRLVLESLENRNLLAADFFVNDNWHFVEDVDLSGSLTAGDRVSNANDAVGDAVIAEYGVDAYGIVTTGAFTGSIAGFETIQDAIDAAAAGEEVIVLEGTYAENLTIATDDLTLTGHTGVATDVVIAPPAAGNGIDITGNNALIRHLQVTAATQHGIFASAVDTVTLDNVQSDSHTQDGFHAENITGTVTVTGGVFLDNGGDGVFIDGADTVTLTDTTASNNGDDGVELAEIATAATLEAVATSDNVSLGFHVHNAAVQATLTLSDLVHVNNTGGVGGTITNFQTVNFTTTTPPGDTVDEVELTSTQWEHTRAGTLQQPVEYQGVEQLNIFTEDGDDVVSITSTLAGVTYEVHGGDGADAITFNSTNASTVRLFGDAGIDTIEVQDTGTGAGTLTQVSGGEGDDLITIVTTGDNSTTNVSGDADDDTINIQSTGTGSQTTVTGGDGSDTINIGDAGNSLDLINGTIDVQGEGALGDEDVLNINDQGDNDNNNYDITATEIQRTGAALITYATLETINVRAGSGDNVFNVASTAADTTLNLFAGDGSDTINVGDAGNSLDLINGPIVVHGEGAAADEDVLNINDQGDNDNNTYDVSATEIQRTGAALITYDTVETITIHAGDGDNTFNVASTATNTTLNLFAGNGSDTVNIGDAGNSLDLINGEIFVHGEGAAGDEDELNINDQGDNDDNDYTLDATTIQRTGAALITYDTVETVNVRAGGGANEFDVVTTAANIHVNLFAGGAGDTITIQTTGAGSTTTAHGEAGVDTITVQNTGANSITQVFGDAGGDTILIENTGAGAVTEASGGDGDDQISLITSGNASTTRLFGDAGEDTLSVLGTGNGSQTEVEGGANDDTINIGDATNSLDTILGPITVSGDAGTDVLNINDQGDNDNNDYAIDATTIARTGAALITYGTVETINIRSGDGLNEFAVSATAANTNLNLFAGGQDDTFNIGNAGNSLDQILGAINIDGGAGSDVLNVNDQGDVNDNDYTLDATTIQRTGAGLITYNAVETVNVHAGSGANEFAVVTTAAGINMNLFAGDGNDSFTVTTTGTLSNTQLFGEGGDDAMDITNTGATSQTLADGGIGNDAITLGSSGINSTTELNGRAGNDQIAVHGTGSGSTTLVRGNGNNDVITIGRTGSPGDPGLNQIALDSIVAVDGGINDPVVRNVSNPRAVLPFPYTNASELQPPTTSMGLVGDTLVINDIGGGLYQLDGDDVRRIGGPQIDYLNVETLIVAPTTGDNHLTVNMQNGPLPTLVKFLGGDGTDHMVIQGSNAADNITVNQGDNLGAGTNDIGPFSVSGVECLHLIGGNGADNIINNAKIPSLIEGNNGRDILVGSSETDIIFGGAGVDALLGRGGDDFLFADIELVFMGSQPVGVLTSNDPMGLGDLINGGPGVNSAAQLGAADIIRSITGTLLDGGGQKDVFTWLRVQALPLNPTNLQILIDRAFDAVDCDFGPTTIAEPEAASVPLNLLHNPLQNTDVDGDGITTTNDVRTLISHLVTGGAASEAPGSRYAWFPDTSNDGRVNTRDILTVLSAVLRGENRTPYDDDAETAGNTAIDAVFSDLGDDDEDDVLEPLVDDDAALFELLARRRSS